MQTIKNRLLRSGKWALGGTLLSSVLGLGINALLARLLTISDLGIYFLLIGFVALSTTLAQAGILHVLLRRVALSPFVGLLRDAAQDIKCVCVYVGIGLVIVCTLVFISFGYWLDVFVQQVPRLDSLVFLVILWTVILAYQGVVTESFRGLHDVRAAILFGGIIANTLLITALSILFIKTSAISLIHVVILIICTASLSLILGLTLLSKRVISTQRSVKISHLESLGREAAPLLLSGLLMVVLTQGDLWLVGLYLGNEDAAIYGAAVKLAILSGMPLNLVNAVLPPYIAQLHATRQYAELGKILRVSAAFASIPALMMAGIAILAGDQVLGHLYGENFRQAAPLFAILCAGQLIHVLLGSGGLVLMLTGNGKTLMVITLMSSLLLVAGGMAAASFGAIGIALAAATALVFQKVVMWKWIRSNLGITTHAKFDEGMWRIFGTLLKR